MNRRSRDRRSVEKIVETVLALLKSRGTKVALLAGGLTVAPTFVSKTEVVVLHIHDCAASPQHVETPDDLPAKPLPAPQQGRWGTSGRRKQ